MHTDGGSPRHLHIVHDDHERRTCDYCGSDEHLIHYRGPNNDSYVHDCAANGCTDYIDDDYLDNLTAVEHYLHHAAANYHVPGPWGCLLGRLRRR